MTLQTSLIEHPVKGYLCLSSVASIFNRNEEFLVTLFSERETYWGNGANNDMQVLKNECRRIPISWST